MKFGRLPLDEAEGAILAHGLTLDGRRLKKGYRLTADDVDGLRSAGAATVLSALLEAGDVGEDKAAEALAASLCGSGGETNAPFTGRCNIYAQHAGIIEFDSDVIHGVNAVDEGITVATLPPFAGALPDTPMEPTYWSPEKDALRRALNEWLRTAEFHDGLADLDQTLSARDDDMRLAPAFDSGDHLHPGAEGNRAMAEAVAMTLLKGDTE